MVDYAITTFGRLDCGLDNAGIDGQLAGITELEGNDLGRVPGSKLKGTFLCMQVQARAMLASCKAYRNGGYLKCSRGVSVQ